VSPAATPRGRKSNRLNPIADLHPTQDTEVIARGTALRNRKRLAQQFGSGRWRKLKGVATVRLADGVTCRAELHWYEAHGIGRRMMKIKRFLEDS